MNLKHLALKVAAYAYLVLVLVALVAVCDDDGEEQTAKVEKSRYDCRHIACLARSGGDAVYRAYKKELKRDTRERCAICCEGHQYKYSFLQRRRDDWRLCKCSDSVVKRVFKRA